MRYFYSSLLLMMTTAGLSAVQAEPVYQQFKVGNVIIDVVKIKDFQKLKLYLNNRQQQPYQNFAAVAQDLRPCEQLKFAMNAGMYHANFAPVGLYIENYKTSTPLNARSGYGNFFMQPNGVLAWNNKTATIQTTQAFKKSAFPARFATQSGPMLLSAGKINPAFIADSSSVKIRNGVGIKDQQLYFAISRQPLNFYQFAQLFKQTLAVTDALYLDGSVSSAYIAQIQTHNNSSALGPMLVYSQHRHNCPN